MIDLDFSLDDLFRGTTIWSRIGRAVSVLYLGALGIYLFRGGWHEWPPPWPLPTIALFFVVLGAGAVTGALTHQATDSLRAAKGSIAYPIGSVLPFTVCVATIGLGFIWLLG